MASLSIRDVYKTYPNGVPVLKGVNIDIEDGQFLILVGGSGCGKSTLLPVAGLEGRDHGRDPDRRQRSTTSRRRIGISRWCSRLRAVSAMSVFENLSFGLKIREVPEAG